MDAPKWFQDEVQRIDPDWFVVFNPRRGRWQIRKWLQTHKPSDLVCFERWAPKSIAVMTVCYQDEDNQKDIGYKELDYRTLLALKLSRWNADNPEALMRDIDEHNAKIEAEFEQGVEDMSKELAKSIWHHYREITLDMGA